MYPVWGGVVNPLVARAGVQALYSRGYKLLYLAVVHVGRHAYFWCAIARNLPKVCLVWAGTALAEEAPEGEVALVAPLRLPCNSVVDFSTAGVAGATLVGLLRVDVVVSVVLVAKIGLAVVVDRFCPVRRRSLIIHRVVVCCCLSRPPLPLRTHS